MPSGYMYTQDNLVEALSNPHLQNMLVELDQADDSVSALKEAMRIPIFAEFAAGCLDHCGLAAEAEET